MKKFLLFSMLLISHISFLQGEIRSYGVADKDAVMEICFQDPLQFFSGSHVVKLGVMTEEHFMSEGRKEMEAILNETLKVKKVLIDSGKVVGFIEFFKTKEMSLESLKRKMESKGLPFDEKQVSTVMPHLKKTDAECEEFIEIESIVVGKNSRGKGYGRALLKDAEDTIKQLWPTIKIIQLNVNEQNPVARKLYESEEFAVSSNQPAHLVMMKVVEYTKEL